MNSSQDTARHTCCHCQSEVLTVNGCTPLDEDTKRLLLPSMLEGHELGTKKLLPLKHNPDAVREAALSGCPFFVTLWGKLDEFATPEALKEMRLFFELGGVKLEQTPVFSSESADSNSLVPTIDHSCQNLYDITECNVLAITEDDARHLEWFNAISDWGMTFVLQAFSPVVYLPPMLLTFKADDPSADYALARLVDGHTSSSQAIGQLRRQLQYCLAHHDDCKAVFSNITPRRFLSVGGSEDPIVKVIQTRDLENVNAEPYAALSYCWGQDQILKLTSANMVYMEDGIPLSSLPKTITDAVRITRELGIKLLWVDSLCLVQDKEDDLAKEVAKMHHYYGNACITISAATAASCNEGFLGDHAMPRTFEHLHGDTFYFPFDLGVPERLSLLKLCELGFESQVIDSRAWTLQEGLLSHRLISFTSRAIRWVCRTESYGKHNFDRLRHLRNSLISACSGADGLSDQQLAFRRLRVWCDVIENYTKRSLSNQGDKLPAISAIASVLLATSTDSPERQHQIDFVAGLMHYELTHPLSVVESSRPEIKYHPRDRFESGFLAFQLLWRLDRCAVRTGLESPIQNSQPSSYIAPSWSWASCLDAVRTGVLGMNDEWFELFILAAWEQGLRVREVTAVPSKSEAPYGALSSGSITIDGYIFCPDGDHEDILSIFLDVGGPEITPSGCSGLFCLQIVPKITQHSQNHRVSELYKSRRRSHPVGLVVDGPHGIVLEPVELESQFSSDERVYRRVGVYSPVDNPYEYFKFENLTFSVEELGGKFERLTII